MRRAFAGLAAGSAFWHSSFTRVGFAFDIRLISAISYIGHLILIENFPHTTKILRDIDMPHNPKSISRTMSELTRSFKDNDASIWKQSLDYADVPYDYMLTFAAMWANTLALVLPWPMTEVLMTFISSNLLYRF